MLDFLFWVSAKKVVVTCAAIGALLVVLAPKLCHSSRQVKQEKNTAMGVRAIHAEKILIMIGYMFVGLSVTLFVIAGFIVDLK